MKLTEAIKICENFALKHKVVFQDKGEVGFGRKCVGFVKGDSYVDYNPVNMNTYEPIKELHSDKHYDILPDHAYHKHDCLAVLIESDNDQSSAIKELAQWALDLEKHKCKLVEYSTGASGVQAILSGVKSYTLII